MTGADGRDALPDRAGAALAGEVLAEALADLLAREATLLRAGAFDALDALAQEKEALAVDLAAAEVPPPAAAARQLQAAAQRNALLLEAARDGLCAARRRLAELAAPPPVLHTYDGSGRRARLDPEPPRNSRRS